MSDPVVTAEFTAVFRIQSVDVPDGNGQLTLHRVPPEGSNSRVVFDVNALQGRGASSAIQKDNTNIAVLNEVIAAWTQQFSAASNRLILDFEEQVRQKGEPQDEDAHGASRENRG
jgi:hypothetical protein